MSGVVWCSGAGANFFSCCFNIPVNGINSTKKVIVENVTESRKDKYMLGINTSFNNPQCNRPSFGMSLQLSKEVMPTISEQASKLSQIQKEKFLNAFKNLDKSEKNNHLVDIFIGQTNIRNALTAEVVPKNGFFGKTFTQPLFRKTGDTSFLEKAKKYADRLNVQVAEKIKAHAEVKKAFADIHKNEPLADIPMRPLFL